MQGKNHAAPALRLCRLAIAPQFSGQDPYPKPMLCAQNWRKVMKGRAPGTTPTKPASQALSSQPRPLPQARHEGRRVEKASAWKAQEQTTSAPCLA
jgi:hypothetical protein